MQINKKLIHFSKKEDFVQRNEMGDIKNTSIVFIKDTNEIYTHGKEYQFVGWSYLTIDVPEGYDLFYAQDELFNTSDGVFFVKL